MVVFGNKFRMSNQHGSSFAPPADVEGMLHLDRKAFTKTVLIPAVRIDAKHCNNLRKALSRVILKKPRIKDILSEQSNKNRKLILLDSSFCGNDHLTVEEKRSISECNGEMLEHELVMTYDHYSADQILAAVLPRGTEITTSFETVGHIAHMNLKECHVPFQELIGQVILDKNPSIKTVVNKTDSIEETFRFFKMELLAGKDDMHACVKQHGCTFEFDFSKVYWNSRLQTEHQRIVDILKSNDTVCDVFAGVGPFAIPAAKKGCTVYANDLNPESYKALNHNIDVNKVKHKVHSRNIDGREFLREIFSLVPSNSAAEYTDNTVLKVDHVIMNLPAIAIDFLDVFSNTGCNKFDGDVTIHCYCFSKKENPFEDAEDRVRRILGNKAGECSVHLVRNVAPQKVMMCVSFKLLNLDQRTRHDNPCVAICPQETQNKKGIKRKAAD